MLARFLLLFNVWRVVWCGMTWWSVNVPYHIVLQDSACRVLPTDRSIGEENFWRTFARSTRTVEEILIRLYHRIDATCCLTTATTTTTTTTTHSLRHRRKDSAPKFVLRDVETQDRRITKKGDTTFVSKL